MDVDSKEFAEQAEIDLMRALNLYKSGDDDLGFAVFSAQQGLEKYLKAYLIHVGIFKDPKELGHLPISLVLKKIIEYIREVKKLENSLIFDSYFDAIIRYFENQRKVLEEIKNSPKLQIILWKASLGMQTNDVEEINSTKQLLILLENGKDECRNGLIKVLTSFQPNSAQILNLDEKTRNEVTDLMMKLLMPFIENRRSTDDPASIFTKLFSILNPYWITHGLMTEKDLSLMTKFMDLMIVGNYVTEAIFAYVHEQISRYPTTINGKSSRELYKENKNNVVNLIQSIKEKGEKLKQKLNS